MKPKGKRRLFNLMNLEKWLKENTESLKDKTVAISGSTGGIGAELCDYLARLGANLIFLDRNEKKAAILNKSLKQKYGELKTDYIKLDLEDIYSVKNATESLKELKPDILILNAGAYSIPRHKCSTGYDNVFQINFASPYYIVKELKPILEENNGRVVAVGSIAHNYSKTDMEDFDFRTRKRASLVYGNAKRFLMFSLLSLCDGEKGLSIVHPGITFTNITAHYPKLIFAVIKHPMKVIFMKPKIACLSILRGVFEDCKENQWIGPRLFDVWGRPKKKILKTCKSFERERIFLKAEQIYEDMKK